LAHGLEIVVVSPAVPDDAGGFLKGVTMTTLKDKVAIKNAAIRSLLHDIDEHIKNQPLDNIDYGHLGSAVHVLESLKDIADFLNIKY
jgi:urocanate hydratase